MPCLDSVKDKVTSEDTHSMVKRNNKQQLKRVPYRDVHQSAVSCPLMADEHHAEKPGI